MTSLSLIVPTHREDRPLHRCLNSVAQQLGPDDQVLVVGDTHDGPLPKVEGLVGEYDWRFRYLALDAGHHCYGHCQVNLGIAEAEGDWINVNDDDDVWTPSALSAMRAAAATSDGLPQLFRFWSYLGMIFWAQRGRLERNWVGGHCLLAPNVPGKLGRFSCAYNGDFDWVADTILHHDHQVIWREEIIAVARPA